MSQVSADSESESGAMAGSKRRSIGDELAPRMRERLEALRAFVRAGGACPVRPRLLAQILKADRDLIGLGLGVRQPHGDCLVIERASLARIVEQEGYLLDVQALGDPAVLVAEPTPDQLDALPDELLRARLAALEAHARVHERLEREIRARRLGPREARAFAAAIGVEAWAEARLVLDAEDRLLPPVDDVSIAIEVAATFLELTWFAPHLVRAWFPSLDRERARAAIEALGAPIDLAAAVGAERADALLAYTAGANPLPEELDREAQQAGEDASAAAHGERSAAPALDEVHDAPSMDHARAAALLARAAHARSRSNLVGAMRLRRQAQHAMGNPREVRAATLANDTDLRALAARLHAALAAPEPSAARWYEVLQPLVRDLGRGLWSPRARLLYDLQRACLDVEQPGFAVHLGRWARSLGAEPLRQTLGEQVPVRVHRHLRGALVKALSLKCPRAVQRPLLDALRAAEHGAGAAVRARFAPRIRAVLGEVGLTPQNLAEEVAREKVVHTLTDRIVERDYLAFGDLRDAVSTSDLKMQDLSDPVLFLTGDALLQADRKLAVRLEGVYRKSPAYMRLLQRVSSLAFGNRVGRALTRWVAIPFGAAFVALEGIKHIVEPVARFAGAHPPELVSRATVIPLGLSVLALIEWRALRARTVETAKLAGRTLRVALVDLPKRALELPAVQRVLDSYAMALTRRFLLKPLVPAALLWLLLPLAGIDRRAGLPACAALFAASSVFANSRWGRELEARLGDRLALWWGRVRHRVVPNLFRLIMETSRYVLGTIERLAYTVDEALRFREGDARLALVGKVIGGSIWSGVMYIVQLYVNLLIEPQVNPIKHFPVVTVSHKVILPLTPTLLDAFRAPLVPILGTYIGNTIAGVTVFLFPGVFGFLVWELSANWRLYEASRPARLGPVRLGAHGETMAALLRPGFHSGTIPKVYGRIRRRALASHRRGRMPVRGKDEAELHHIEEAVSRFVERELCELLAQSGALEGRLAVERVRLGMTFVEVSLRVLRAASAEDANTNDDVSTSDDVERPLLLSYAERAGTLVARIEAGRAADLPERARAALADAMHGLLRRSDVARIELAHESEAGDSAPPALAPEPIGWAAWVARWEAERASASPTPAHAPGPLGPSLLGPT